MKFLIGALVVFFLLRALYLRWLFVVCWRSYMILSAAGNMRTGNDLAERLKEVQRKAGAPNFWRWYGKRVKRQAGLFFIF